MRCLLLLLATLLPLVSAAQPFTPDRRLLLSEGVLRGSPRLMGIAGAFVGIAEGAEGMTRNPAAVASRDPHFERELNFDFGAAMHFLPPWAVLEQDWDLDGGPDQVGELGGPLDFLGTQVLYFAGSAQYRQVGAGLGIDVQNFVARTPERGFNLSLVHVFASLGGSLWDDQILIGLGAESTHAVFGYLENRQVRQTLGYNGFGVQFGGLWRPKWQNYRIGFAYRPQTQANPDVQRLEIGGLVPFSSVVAPARLSLGGSIALGHDGRDYNITSPADWRSALKNPDGSPVYSALTRWLITAQLDVFFPVYNATYVAPFFGQDLGVPALAAGDQIAFLPRAAIEKEIWEDRLRLRAGGYLEPPLVETGYLRPHATFGFELYLFKLGPQRLAFGLSFDLARQFQNLSVAFIAWK